MCSARGVCTAEMLFGKDFLCIFLFFLSCILKISLYVIAIWKSMKICSYTIQYDMSSRLLHNCEASSLKALQLLAQNVPYNH